MTPELEAAYRACRGVARRSSSNFACIDWLLPLDQRRGMEACMPSPAAAMTSPTAASRSIIAAQRLAQLARISFAQRWPGMPTIRSWSRWPTRSRGSSCRSICCGGFSMASRWIWTRRVCDLCRVAAVLRARRVGGGPGMPGDLGLPQR